MMLLPTPAGYQHHKTHHKNKAFALQEDQLHPDKQKDADVINLNDYVTNLYV